VKFSLILLLIILFSCQSTSQNFDAKLFFETSIKNSKAKAFEFVNLYFTQKNFKKAHELLCPDIAEITPLSSLEAVYEQLNKFADLKQFKNSEIIDVNVQLHETEPYGLVNYVVVLKDDDDQKLTGSVTFRANETCMWGWRFQPMMIKSFDVDS
jgi:hypothetical protein|tara:strand:- start:12724 stop:13185 length:462 start_codon:yes stop_codon:yes gene_type:complete